MPLFWKPYQSEVTALIQDLKTQRPQLEAEQRQGRALLWEPGMDRETQAQFNAARVPQGAYVYGHRKP